MHLRVAGSPRREPKALPVHKDPLAPPVHKDPLALAALRARRGQLGHLVLPDLPVQKEIPARR